MTNKIYHEHKAKGSTYIKKAAEKSILHAENQNFKTTPAMTLGSAFHVMNLEPELFSSQFVFEEINKRTNVGKARVLELSDMGVTILSAEEFEKVQGMTASLNRHPLAKEMFKGGVSEMSHFAELDGVPAKCRTDYEKGGKIIDLKSCIDASPEGFASAVAKYGYHIQVAYYVDVYNAANSAKLTYEDFFFVCVENTAPYAVAVYTLDKDSYETGQKLYKKVLKEYKNYLSQTNPLEANLEAGYYAGILSLSLPLWVHSKAETRITEIEEGEAV